jgi:hypothetical protein
MKNIILFTFLFFPLLGFSQNNRDSIIMRNPQTKSIELIQTNPNLLLSSVATNLENAGKSYETADNLLILGALSMIAGSILYSKQISNKTPGKISDGSGGQLLMGAGVVLNVYSLFERYNGHRNLKESGQNLKNYTKSLK